MKQFSRPSIIATLTFVAVGGLLAWLVTITSLAAFLSEAVPERALALQPSEPSALLYRAEKLLNEILVRDAAAISAKASAKPKTGTKQPQAAVLSSNDDAGTIDDIRKIHDWTVKAVKGDPMNAKAYRILGQLAARAGSEARAIKFMQTAVDRSQRESVAVYWLMIKAYQTRDHGNALHYADVLLRSRRSVDKLVMPVLGRLAERKEAFSRLLRLIATKPPWRGQFFAALPRHISNAHTPLKLLYALRKTSAPPTTGELHSYINFLMRRKSYGLAYYTWLQFLPPEQLTKIGLLFNGSFEINPSDFPFDWRIRSGQNATIGIATPAGTTSKHALFLQFKNGRVSFPPVLQMTMLAPGSYRLDGRNNGQINGTRGLVWRVRCVRSGKDLAMTAMIFGDVQKQQSFQMRFTVPRSGCQAQWLSLYHDSRSASEQLLTGTIWFDDLKITQAATVPGK